MKSSLQNSPKLFLNHLDAWGVATIIAVLALFLNDALRWPDLWLILAVGSGYWLAFTMNDYFDAPYDAQEPAKAARNFFVQVPIPHARARLLFWLLGSPLIIILVQYGWRGALVAAVGIFIMWSYSAPPLRLKSRLGLDLVVHAVFVETYPYWLCLTVIQAEWTAVDYAVLSITFLASLSAQLEQQVRDYEVDARTSPNFATRVGRPTTYRLLQWVTGLLIVTAVTISVTQIVPWYLIPYALIALPAMIHRLVRGMDGVRPQWLVYVSAGAGMVYTIGLVIGFWLMGNG